MARRLCLDERARIEAMARAGLGAARIARCLGRHRSTVQRELARAGGPQGYRAGFAQQAAGARARRPRAPKLARDRVLAAAVAERLAQRWSPHAISADLGVRGLGVCAETVYRACYDHTGRSGLKPGSWNKLPRQRRRRKPRGRCEQAKRSPAGRVPAHSRQARRKPPARVRARLTGRETSSSDAPTALRSPHWLKEPAATPWWCRYPAATTPKTPPRAITAALARQPARMVKTLAWDQGREMARWADIEKTLGIEVYFCEPRSPWQRPTNEQTNGLLRRWLPKSTDLDIGRSAPRCHRRQPQHHAPQTPPLELSPNRLR